VLSVTNALFFRSLPIPDAEQVMTMTVLREEGAPAQVISYPDYLAYRDGTEAAFSSFAALANWSFAVRGAEGAESVPGAFVSGNYFRMLQVEPALGRFLTPDDDRAGAPPAVVLGHQLWRERFGGDPAVVGSTVHLNAQPLTVVGVASERFRGSLLTSAPQLWVPIAARHFLAPTLVESEGTNINWLRPQGRLAAGVERGQAAAALTVVGRQISAERAPPQQVVGIGLAPAGRVPENMRGEATTLSGILLIASAMVLLIASINVAGMLLARATARRREIGIRLAIGAPTRRLVRQLLTESVLLFLVGGVVGVAFGYWLTGLLASLLTVQGGPLPLQNLAVPMEGGVLALALLVSLVIGVVFGLAPALQAARTELVASLKDAGAAGRGPSALRSLLVVGQVSMCLLLLLATGLLMRSLYEAGRVELGFEPAGVLTGRLNLQGSGYDDVTGAAVMHELRERLSAIPEVQAAAFAYARPLGGMGMDTGLEVGGGESVPVSYNLVGPGYFETLGIPLLQGRALTETDGPTAPRVAVVNEAFTRQHFPGESVVGRTVRVAGEETEIVGVAGDSRWESLDEQAVPFVYTSLAQDPQASTALLLRTAGDPTSLEATVRREIRVLDSDLPFQGVTTLEESVRQLTLSQRIAAQGAGAFGLVGLLLAVVGLYGLLSYLVAQRTREIGLRMALGARSRNVIRLVLREGALLVSAGAVLGALASLWLLPALGDLLFGVAPTDPVAVVGVVLLLVAVTLAACLVPARRAARVDPMTALRAE
jgi:predicted permease